MNQPLHKMTNGFYTLAHELDRPGQLEMAEAILASDKKFILGDAPTGSGKSAFAAFASLFHRIMVLTKTRSLQYENYEKGYDFDVIVGVGSYQCGNDPNIRANQCLDKADGRCDEFCPAHVARRKALESPRLSINTAKYLIDRMLVEDHKTDILFIDEAHLIGDAVMDWTGASVPWEDDFWTLQPTILKPGVEMAERLASKKILHEMITMGIDEEPPRAINVGGQKIINPEWIDWERKLGRLRYILGRLDETGVGSTPYFFQSDEEKIEIKPLSPKRDFKRLFAGYSGKVVLMSATIASPDVFTRSLGIEQDEYDFFQLPNRYPAEARQIVDLGAPAIKYASERNPKEWAKLQKNRQRQAELIAGKMQENGGTGVVHFKSKAQCWDMKKRLEGLGLRVHIPTSGDSTEYQLRGWQDARRYNDICCAWSFWEGVELGEDKSIFIGKTPFPYLGDELGKARKKADPDTYSLKAANDIMQGAGRNRRVDEHFNPGARHVYLVDGAYRYLMKYYSPSFRDAIVRPKQKYKLSF